MIKLVISDMDGTLLNQDKQIPESFREILPQLEEKGIRFAVASGRQYPTLQDLFKRAQQEIIYIAENGGLVEYQGEILASDLMEKKDLLAMMKLSKQYSGTCFLVSSEKMAFIEQPQEQHILEEIQSYFHHLQIVEDLTRIEQPLLKFSIYHPEEIQGALFEAFSPFQKEYHVVIAGEHWIDISPLETNKGKAVRQVKEKLGITSEEVMIFGDQLNDAPMMQEAKWSYAMKNANPELKKFAQYETKFSNTEEGVVATLRELLSS